MHLGCLESFPSKMRAIVMQRQTEIVNTVNIYLEMRCWACERHWSISHGCWLPHEENIDTGLCLHVTTSLHQV